MLTSSTLSSSSTSVLPSGPPSTLLMVSEHRVDSHDNLKPNFVLSQCVRKLSLHSVLVFFSNEGDL